MHERISRAESLAVTKSAHCSNFKEGEWVRALAGTFLVFEECPLRRRKGTLLEDEECPLPMSSLRSLFNF